MKKRILAAGLMLTLAVSMITGCKSKKTEGFDTSQSIGVTTREDGSGTRGAFIELVGIEAKNADGEKVDNTIASAVTTNSTAVMMTTVAGDKYSIGYISLGSMNDTVKAVTIDGVAATTANVKNGTYTVARPFNIATKAEVSDVTADFIKFILSTDGQKVVSDSGYVSIDTTEAYTASNLSGKVTVGGSTSVSPVMQKLKEAYEALNKDVTIEISTSDSSTGMTSTIEGVCDIGMASRELKESELSEGITGTVIAMDGIAVIVNNESTITNLTTEQVCDIYTGKITKWSEIK